MSKCGRFSPCLKIVAFLILLASAPGAYSETTNKAIVIWSQSCPDYRSASKDDIASFKFVPLPTNHITLLETKFREMCKDPDSVKFYWDFSAPEKACYQFRGRLHGGWKTFVNVNAKNSFAGYTGKRFYILYLEDSGLVVFPGFLKQMGNSPVWFCDLLCNESGPQDILN